MICIPELERELELKDFERNELELKDFKCNWNLIKSQPGCIAVQAMVFNDQKMIMYFKYIKDHVW